MINAEARHDPKDLLEWGNASAMLYLNKGHPLSQAVCEVVKNKSLTTEHIQRILEVANITSYLAEYDRIKGPSKVVVFPGGPATLAKVLDILNEGTKSESLIAPRREEEMPNKDYEDEPRDYKIEKAAAYLNLFENKGEMEKAASDVSSLEDLKKIKTGEISKESLEGLYFKVDGAIKQLEGEVIKLSSVQHELENKLFSMVKEAVHDGNSLGDIRRVSSPAEDIALDGIIMKVANSMTSSFPDQQTVSNSLNKISFDKEPDMEHPLRGSAVIYRKVLDDIRTKAASIDILRDHQKNIRNQIAAKKR